MKQRPPKPAGRGHVDSKPPGQALKAPRLSAATQRLAPTLLGKHRKISYVPGEKPRKESFEARQLYIRELGGNLRMDLGGVGIRLSKVAFLHWVADDALRPVGIHRGDIVLIEPVVRRLHEGNLVLVEVRGRPALLRLRKHKRLWMLAPVDGTSSEPMLLYDYGIQGAAIGVVRLFNELRPQKYEWNDPNHGIGFEIPYPKSRGSKPVPLEKRHPATGRATPGRQIERFFPLPPTDGKAKLRLNDTDKENFYKGRPDKR